METRAIRLYGEKDLRLDTFELPPLKDDDILVKIISDSVCMSTYKLACQGGAHKRAPKDIANNPAVIGHEMSGVISQVGEKWKDRYHVGQKFTVLPVITVDGVLKTAGYYYGTYGGDSTYSIIPGEYVERDCIIPFEGDSFFEASLSEPTSCIIAGYHRMYHTSEENHQHIMEVKKDGQLAIFGACGPMGLECIDYALQKEDGPKQIVAIDVTKDRLDRADKMLSKKVQPGTTLTFVDASEHDDIVQYLMSLTDNKGFDDVFVYAPVRPLIEQADQVLAKDGCLNFFAGPVDKQLSATINMYNIHYNYSHYIGFTGSVTSDILEALKLMEEKKITPAVMVTHIGGLESAIDATLNLPQIPGGKKMIYPHIDMPLTAIDDFESLGEANPMFKELDELCKKHDGCWNHEAEKVLLEAYHVDTTQ